MKLAYLRRFLFPLLAAIFAFSVGTLGSAYLPLEPPPGSSITIEPGSSLIQVAKDLKKKKIIRSPLVLRLIARLKSQESSIQAGTYSFTLKATPGEVLTRLVKGDVDHTKVTIPEGFDLQQIVTRLNDEGVADKSRLLELSSSTEFLKSLDIEASSLEGYLFPETYRFAPGISEADLLRMMVSEFKTQFYRLIKSQQKDLPLDKHQLITLASIIQKETGLVAEMPLISSVFHNRLQRNIPLQTDPTVIYGIENFNGNLTRKDLKRPSPYNTYLNRGLPPGPIASPGYNALLAAAMPAESKFLYFVARGDGSHQFSKTLKEHNAAVLKYQLRRKR